MKGVDVKKGEKFLPNRFLQTKITKSIGKCFGTAFFNSKPFLGQKKNTAQKHLKSAHINIKFLVNFVILFWKNCVRICFSIFQTYPRWLEDFCSMGIKKSGKIRWPIFKGYIFPRIQHQSQNFQIYLFFQLSQFIFKFQKIILLSIV